MATEIKVDGRWAGVGPSADTIIAGDMASLLLMLGASGRMVGPSERIDLNTAFGERVVQNAV
jgi:hypothetical protein